VRTKFSDRGVNSIPILEGEPIPALLSQNPVTNLCRHVGWVKI
jgi:hypothetical protein